MDSKQLRRKWRSTGIYLALLFVLTFILYQPTFLYLGRLWNQLETGEYAHGYLVLAISVYMIFRHRDALAEYAPAPSYRALPAVAASSLLWLLAALVDVKMMQALSLLLLVLSVTWLVLGDRAIKILLFPILFVGFAIPIWFPLSPVLQDITADAVFWAIRLIEVPTMREENLIILPAGKLSVEEACSGLRYLLAALTLGCLYAYLNYETLRARIVVVLVSAGAAVLANILRVFIVVYLGYSTDMQHPYVHDHLMLGWYLFGGVVVLLLMVDTLIQRHLRREHGQQERAEAVRAHGGPDAVTSGQAPSKYALSAFLGILLLSVGPAVAHSINNLPERNIIRMDIELSETLGDWESAADFKDDWKPLYHGASEIKQAFHRSDDRIVLYAGCYGTQTQGKELINDLNRINNEDVWRAVYPRGRIVRQGDDWALEQILEAKDGRQRLVWYWYRLSGKDVVNKYLAKIFQLSSLITTKPQACVIAAATDVGQDFETARERLAEFLLEAGPAVVLMYDEL